MDALAQAAFTYAAGGYQVICDGIVRPWFIDVFRTAAAARAIPRPTTSSCARTRPPRCAGDRPGGLALADPEPIRSLHRHFTDIGEFGRHVIDSTQLSQQATTDAVRRGLDEGTYLLS